MKLSDILATLREIRVSPAKTLGQNFLHDQNLARWIVDQAQITSDDYVVEIGPGLGALTRFILEKGAHVLAIEKDARLAGFLRTHFPNQRLEILDSDALKFDPRSLFAHRTVKLLGNLPYNVSSVLLLRFLEQPSPISLLLLMLQKEVAERLSASPSTHDYGALTLRVQLHHHVKYLRTVPATVFFPRPEVDSAVVRILPRDPLELPQHDDQLLRRLVRAGFSQRRKQLRKLIREHIKDWDTVSRRLNIGANARAEELSLPQWIALANCIAPPPDPDTAVNRNERFPIVDKKDRILRYANRSEVHGNNLRHRAVHILIFNEAGELYLQQRSRWKDRHPLKWDSSAAGHVAFRESYDETARRELKEELGTTVPLHKVSKVSASQRTDHEFIWLYRGLTSGDLVPDNSEIEQGAFFRPAVIDGWTSARPEDFAPGFLECWKAYRRKTRAA
ncbi:MAG: ribosomal RNA small subunit methyltransferase A [Verrucomicrobia bacterium]|nr:MAG: ribosomal RNA small subunit methyltransferase A [Verrucomicrobia bacterium 13_2_20CM_2_54_15_9cls]PYI42667.1 MAG: ribosomal RNA small subunit methyltransferase A [Verrucomicrobiota bacterium]PYI63873.1 MAG: ribosomal RNA small subunit methyltransferase A [Verrucomicrobiota bacterium]